MKMTLPPAFEHFFSFAGQFIRFRFKLRETKLCKEPPASSIKCNIKLKSQPAPRTLPRHTDKTKRRWKQQLASELVILETNIYIVFYIIPKTLSTFLVVRFPSLSSNSASIAFTGCTGLSHFPAWWFTFIYLKEFLLIMQRELHYVLQKL